MKKFIHSPLENRQAANIAASKSYYQILNTNAIRHLCQSVCCLRTAQQYKLLPIIKRRLSEISFHFDLLFTGGNIPKILANLHSRKLVEVSMILKRNVIYYVLYIIIILFNIKLPQYANEE
uniref:Uncharacterized protein n=1 Tax=Glossina pallidipes TaxID=7398 RepID=A0A1B0A9Z3_GLOPL